MENIICIGSSILFPNYGSGIKVKGNSKNIISSSSASSSLSSLNSSSSSSLLSFQVWFPIDLLVELISFTFIETFLLLKRIE